MIRLKNYSNRNDFVKKYVEDKYTRISKKLDKLDINDKKIFITLFPESYDDNSFNKSFFVDLLSANLYEVIRKYSSVNTYYKIAFISSLNIKEICRGKTKDEASICRKNYLEWFLTNKGEYEQNTKKILEDYKKLRFYVKDIVKYIYLNEENFITFQNSIKKFLLKKRIKRNRFGYGILFELFDYKNMVTSKDKVKIVNDLDVLICPYCNRSYISNFKDKWQEETERTSADLDHFFYKSNFVLFSLSLYNFIPSCKICNSLFKGDKNMDILYPYADSYENEVNFTLIDSDKIVEAKDIYGWTRGKKIDIAYSSHLDKEKKEKIEREIQLFRIREIYQVHNDFAEKLLYSKNILGGSVKKNILDCINKDLKDKQKLDAKEFDKFFYRIDFYNIKEDINKEPLSKLIHDVVNMN